MAPTDKNPGGRMVEGDDAPGADHMFDYVPPSAAEPQADPEPTDDQEPTDG